MKAIKFLLVVITLIISFASCTEDEREEAGPIPNDSVDVPLPADQVAFLETLAETTIPLEDIILENGENVRAFLETNDPDFLQAHPSGRIGKTKALDPLQQKLMFLARLYAMGNYLVDDDPHTYPSAGADSPEQSGLAYSWGSKDYNVRQVPPVSSGCMSLKIYGLDCSGTLWAMTQAARLTVAPKHNFYIRFIAIAQKWTDAFKASADYKDLEMKDMGQLAPNKMKNGDIILWGAHGGVYLSGSFYQSNGTSEAPGCNNNLLPSRGPRLIPVAQVLRYGLGDYKVFRVIYEYKFKLRVQTKHSDPCGYPGQNYFDAADMDVNVKDTVVTVSAPINQGATIMPSVIGIGGTCLLTSEPGATGEINIFSGSGEVHESPFDISTVYLTINLENKGATSAGCIVNCPPAPPIHSPPQLFNSSDSWKFTLKDSAQTIGTQTSQWLATLKPNY